MTTSLFAALSEPQRGTPFMPGDHSELEPPLPIPNRTVKRLHADDSADTRVKVGHRQALIPKTPRQRVLRGVLSLVVLKRSGSLR